MDHPLSPTWTEQLLYEHLLSFSHHGAPSTVMFKVMRLLRSDPYPMRLEMMQCLWVQQESKNQKRELTMEQSKMETIQLVSNLVIGGKNVTV
jgi:hypothetical protein